MSFLSSLFSRNPKSFEDTIKVDMHNHLIFGVDDGAKIIEESIELIKGMVDLGRKKIIMTPHIMSDFYKNGPLNLIPILNILKEKVKELNIDVQLEVAAEYYLDDVFYKMVTEGEELMTFGKNCILFETAFLNEPPQLKSLIFELKSRGLKPVFAHPERYIYLHDNFKRYESLWERDIYFQLNILSLSGYYSPEIKKIAEKLIDAKMVNFISSDCHNVRHLEALKIAIKSKYYQKALELPLLNNSLI